MAVSVKEHHPSLPGRNMLVVEYRAEPASVRDAREAVVGLLRVHGVSGQRVDDVRLAVSEAATNVVMHAYQDQPVGMIRLMAVIGDEQLLVTVEDDGRGLNSPTQRPGMGAGLRIMQTVSDQALFSERETGGSSVQLRFDLDILRNRPIRVDS